MSSKLHVYTRQSHSLIDSLAAFARLIGDLEAKAILYSPQKCQLARFRGGKLQGSNGQAVPLEPIFEARVFNESAELRWLNDPSQAQQHSAVVLTEQAAQEEFTDWQYDPRDTIEILQQTYLLWGEGTEKSMGADWSELATARIGGFPVPIGNVGENQRVLLHSVEYIVAADRNGNAVIFDERLTKLEKSEVKNG